VSGGHELTEEFIARFSRAVEASAFTKRVGVVVESLTAEALRTRLPFHGGLERSLGIVHGGAIFTLMDVTAGAMCAIAHGGIGEGSTMVTVQASTQFLDTARGEDLVCVARPVKIGASLGFVDVDVTAGERPVAHGSFVFKAVRAPR
jgi:protein Tex